MVPEFKPQVYLNLPSTGRIRVLGQFLPADDQLNGVALGFEPWACPDLPSACRDCLMAQAPKLSCQPAIRWLGWTQCLSPETAPICHWLAGTSPELKPPGSPCQLTLGLLWGSSPGIQALGVVPTSHKSANQDSPGVQALGPPWSATSRQGLPHHPCQPTISWFGLLWIWISGTDPECHATCSSYDTIPTSHKDVTFFLSNSFMVGLWFLWCYKFCEHVANSYFWHN